MKKKIFVGLLGLLFLSIFFSAINDFFKVFKLHEGSIFYVEGFATYVFTSPYSINTGMPSTTFRINGDSRDYQYYVDDKNYSKLINNLYERKWLKIGYIYDGVHRGPYQVVYFEDESGVHATLSDFKYQYFLISPVIILVCGYLGFGFVLHSFNTKRSLGIRKYFPRIYKYVNSKEKGIVDTGERVECTITNRNELSIILVYGFCFIYFGATLSFNFFTPYKILGFACLLLGTIGFLIATDLFFRKRPLVCFDKHAIQGFGANINFTKIAWENIEKLEYDSKYVHFTTKNYHKDRWHDFYIDPVNIIVRFVSQFSGYKIFGFYPFIIDTHLYNSTGEEVVNLMEKYSGKKFRETNPNMD